MVFGRSKRSTREISCEELQVGDQKICKVQSYRYLGVFLDLLLSFHNHIEYLRLKLAQNIGSMYRVKIIFPFTILKIIYHSLITSYLNYCSVVYLNTFCKHIKPLQVLQNRAIRILGNFLHRPSKLENVSETKTLFLFLNLLDLNDIRILNNSIWHFQIQNFKNYFYDKSLLILLPHSDCWRSRMYQIPFVSSERSKFSIRYQIPFIANNHKLNDKILFDPSQKSQQKSQLNLKKQILKIVS